MSKTIIIFFFKRAHVQNHSEMIFVHFLKTFLHYLEWDSKPQDKIFYIQKAFVQSDKHFEKPNSVQCPHLSLTFNPIKMCKLVMLFHQKGQRPKKLFHKMLPPLFNWDNKRSAQNPLRGQRRGVMCKSTMYPHLFYIC